MALEPIHAPGGGSVRLSPVAGIAEPGSINLVLADRDGTRQVFMMLSPDNVSELISQLRAWLGLNELIPEQGGGENHRVALALTLEAASQSVAYAYGDDWTPKARRAHDLLRHAVKSLLDDPEVEL